MSAFLNNWIKEIASRDGVLAAGVRYHDRQIFAWSKSPDFQPSEMDVPLRCLADTFQVMTANRFPASRLRWTYEHGFVHGAMRSDGICLGIIARKTDPTPDSDALDRIINEFQTLRS